MLLMLMRTVEAENFSGEIRDSERSITESGRGDAAYAAEFMKALGLEPKVIICSPFKRTVETAQTLADNLDDPPPVQIAHSIMPGAGLDEILKAIKSRVECSEEDWILAVCHEPDISSCVKELLKESGDYKIPVEPGTLIGLELTCHYGQIKGRLIFLFSPMAMRA
ncbi:MAG TPA: histidine phosphatase family protein [Victivallales bacterium]|nr:histidine phosphatase family protein [Victivallales bacterium]HPO90059.1 histidine phosphatase family protein [Victivallales bacterium]HRR28577.1 histidine phosphatase family protein [Victivallales bacterium]HRU02382.1 histidine phosphatase family protein [Victivallales bacterium]